MSAPTSSNQPDGFDVSAPIHPLLATRWSPRDLDPVAEVSSTHLRALLEAGRWAPSWGGTAPARFVAGTRGSQVFATLAGALTPGNAWATYAGALILVLADTTGGKGLESDPLPYATFDAGAAATQIQLQAVAEGLVAHPMAGFDHDAVAAALDVPPGVVPWAMVAVSCPAGTVDAEDPRPNELVQAVTERDAAPRRRPELAEIAFGGTWGTPLATD